MVIMLPTLKIPTILRSIGVAIWALYAFGSAFHSHIGADTSFGGSFLLGLALWGAASVWVDWFPAKPATP